MGLERSEQFSILVFVIEYVARFGWPKIVESSFSASSEWLT
jgi:hypothetical protein